MSTVCSTAISSHSSAATSRCDAKAACPRLLWERTTRRVDVGNQETDLCGRIVVTEAMSILRNAAAIAKGMSITLREGFQPSEVENYPDGKGPLRGAVFQERFRGKHQLQRDENGLEKCVACFLCAAACPSNCIYIEAAENTEEKRISSAERYAKVYNIDYNRCIFCGYCVEACPTDAITHGHGFELASLNATTMVMRKEDLLVPVATGLPHSAQEEAEVLA